MAATCPVCQGKGKYIAPKDQCKTCNGHGRTQKIEKIDVDVPAGIDDEMRVRVPGQGDYPEEGQGRPGDLLIEFRVFNINKVERHKVFTRTGADILLNVDVPLDVAILEVIYLSQQLMGMSN